MMDTLIILSVSTGFFIGTCIVLSCWYCRERNSENIEEEIMPVVRSPLVKNKYVEI